VPLVPPFGLMAPTWSAPRPVRPDGRLLGVHPLPFGLMATCSECTASRSAWWSPARSAPAPVRP